MTLKDFILTYDMDLKDTTNLTKLSQKLQL
jgi:hypothetical protein